MKKYLLFATASLLAAGMAGSCSDDELNDQNKNKPRPTVTLTKDDANASSFTFTITASENSTQYGFAILVGTENEAPSAYDIVTDAVSGAGLTAVYNTADGATQKLRVGAPGGQYQIYAAAITATGLLSEVTLLEINSGNGGGGTTVQLVEGIYEVTYTNPSELSGGQVTPTNPNSGTPFTLYLEDVGQGMYALYNSWFGQFQKPILIGSVDALAGVLVFPDQQLDPATGQIKQGVYGYTQYYMDEAQTQVAAFFGSGDTGTDPIQVAFDGEGKLTQISSFQYEIFDAATEAWVATFDICADGKMEYQGPLPEPEMHKSGSMLPMLTSGYFPVAESRRMLKR